MGFKITEDELREMIKGVIKEETEYQKFFKGDMDNTQSWPNRTENFVKGVFRVRNSNLESDF